MTTIEQLKWPDTGLLPAIAQDARTGTVLTLAWQNRDALQATIDTGYVHYWSRSRQELWKKGETSGHVQRVLDIRLDCDLDAVLMAVEPSGPACHTGAESCFFNERAGDSWQSGATNPWPLADILARLSAVIDERTTSTAGKSYVKSLLDNPATAAAKVQEEAAELVAAAANEPDQNVASEAADAIFHILVLARTRGVDWSRICEVLESRFGVGGHDEKASRSNDRMAKDDSV